MHSKNWNLCTGGICRICPKSSVEVNSTMALYLKMCMTGFGKTCLSSSHVHYSTFQLWSPIKSTWNDSYVARCEICRNCWTTIPLATWQVLNLYTIPCGFYGSPNEKNRMCELCTFSQIRSQIHFIRRVNHAECAGHAFIKRCTIICYAALLNSATVVLNSHNTSLVTSDQHTQ